MSSAAVGMASVAATTSYFESFRQKLYIRGVLGKKNDRSADGKLYNMRKWTRWYVELRGPVLIFWNLLDPQLSAYLEDITAIVDGRVQTTSPEFERTVAHIKNIVLKPNFINITDAACSIVGKLKKRDSVWTLHSSGANRFYMQAVDDRAMNEWVRALRLACFEAAKLYEFYTSALVNERYSAAITAQQRPTEYRVQVRFSGTVDWVPCTMTLQSSPLQVAFRMEDTQKQAAMLTNLRNAYSVYPDSIDMVDTAVIAKLEGDCDIDSSLQPKLEEADGDASGLMVAASRAHGSYALVIFQSPPDMASALAEVSSQARLYNMPTSFMPDVLPSHDDIYLKTTSIADKSIEIMEPVTARRMLENLTSEKCLKLDCSAVVDGGAGYSTSGSTANADSATNSAVLAPPTHSRMPWDSDASSDELAAPANAATTTRVSNKNTSKIVKKVARISKIVDPGSDHEDTSDNQPQKQRHFRFLHKSGKSKEGNRRESSASVKEDGATTVKPEKRDSKQSSTDTATSGKDSVRASTNSNNESASHSSSTAPSLPTPVQSSATRGTFADDASQAIVNLKVDSPPQNNVAQFGSVNVQLNGGDPSGQQARQLAESDTESDSDAPLGNIAALAAQRMSMAYNNDMQQPQNMQQQMQMQMQQRSSMAGPGFGVQGQMQGNQQLLMQQQQQGMMQPQQQMMPNTQSMYGGIPGLNMNPMGQMYPGMQQQQPQQQFMYGQQDPNQMMMMGAGGNMQMQGPGSVRGRPTTYMDAAGGMNMWNQQMGMGMGMGMESAGGPLLTVEKKVDPIERPTGLVGAIATREQMKSEQKYRDSSSLMRERQMRRNQAANMSNNMFGQPGMGGGRFGGGAFPSMYGAPQGWADDTMSMMSGASGRAPYAQMAPSLSAEQLGVHSMRNTMYGGGMQMGAMGGAGMNGMGMNNMAMNGMAMNGMGMNGMGMNGMGANGMPMNGMGMMGANGADVDDDVALSTYAGNNGRMSMAGGVDIHPLRATMQSRMSISSPHLATMNSNAHQQQMLMQQQMQQLSMMPHPTIPAAAAEQQRRMSIASMGGGAVPAMPRSHTYNTISAGSGPFNAVNSRHSLASSASGSGGSSGGSSPLAIQTRVPASRWVKESSNLRIQSNARSGGSDMKASTMPRPRGTTNGSSSNARANITSVYELPGRSSNRTPEKTSSFARPGASRAAAAKYTARFERHSDDDDDEDDDDATNSDGSDSEDMG
ncbi:hypothetical protein H4S06_003123, partial [Coemansia sp. BCRC 34490]